MLALVNGTIYPNPTEEPISGGVVLIADEKIAAVEGREVFPPDAETIDCTGCTITAGLWNSHVHFFERKWADAAAIPAEELGRQLQDMLTRFGFTSVFDLSSVWENTRRLRERIESGEVPGPRIRSTGEGLVPANPGLPSDTVLRIMGVMKAALPEVSNGAEAAVAAGKLLEAGVDGIKLFASSPSKAALTESVMEAAVAAAHRAGKLVFVHPNNVTDLVAAVRAGVDIVGHTTPGSGPWDETILALMLERRVALTPTLTLWKYYLRHDRVSVQERMVETALGQLRAWVAASGQVLFGTDLGAVEYDPSEEYALMAAAGMSFRQILESLTTAPAARFGLDGRVGRVAAGCDADLAVFEGHPPASKVRYTLRAGRVIYRAV
jgi:imidazolonepropionase-like amidohydrolase